MNGTNAVVGQATAMVTIALYDGGHSSSPKEDHLLEASMGTCRGRSTSRTRAPLLTCTKPNSFGCSAGSEGSPPPAPLGHLPSAAALAAASFAARFFAAFCIAFCMAFLPSSLVCVMSQSSPLLHLPRRWNGHHIFFMPPNLGVGDFGRVAVSAWTASAFALALAFALGPGDFGLLAGDAERGLPGAVIPSRTALGGVSCEKGQLSLEHPTLL